MGFNVSCTPGKDAAVAFMRVTEHLPALVIYLDPVNFAIQLPPFPDGELLLAKFCERSRYSRGLRSRYSAGGGSW
jgi:hypothetical protein